MSKYNPSQASYDRLWSQHQYTEETIKELSFKVKAYEKMLSKANVTAVKEELRIRQLLEAYPPLVHDAYERLQEVHEAHHDDNCVCVDRAVEIRNQDAVDNYDPYDDFVEMD